MITTKERLYSLTHTILHPQLEAISEQLDKIEPYSHNSQVRKDLLKAANLLTSLNDYINTIGSGDEEINEDEIEALFRLITSKAISGGISATVAMDSILPPAASDNGVELFINGGSYSSLLPTIIKPFHTYDFKAIYVEDAKLITFTIDNTTISEVGNKVFVENFFVRPTTETSKTVNVTVIKLDDSIATATFTLTLQTD